MSVPKIKIITLGCSKNLVDSRAVAARLRAAGYQAVPEGYARHVDATVINTCGFIGDAKEESIDCILAQCARRRRGPVYVMGCLSQRYRDVLPAEIPEVDRWFGKFDWDAIPAALAADGIAPAPAAVPEPKRTPGHFTYVKIAEGCNRFCAFCAIPLITGRYHSRTVEDIAAEVRDAVARGCREFNVIAQDLSAYGTDIYGRSALARLLETLADIPGVDRIRLHYAYPADFPYDILPVMASRPNICKYLDIALQHIDDTVLRNMRRHIDADETRRLLSRLRAEVPGIHIRTTLMVGFPGESEEAFGRLLDFVREQRFDRMGAFAYCEEDDTYAALHLPDEIPAEVKQARLDRLMAVQQEIAAELNEAKVGATLPVIIDREEEDCYVGRTEFDSPEVDPEVFVSKSRKLKVGEIVPVKITGAMPFELIGEPVS